MPEIPARKFRKFRAEILGRKFRAGIPGIRARKLARNHQGLNISSCRNWPGTAAGTARGALPGGRDEK